MTTVAFLAQKKCQVTGVGSISVVPHHVIVPKVRSYLCVCIKGEEGGGGDGKQQEIEFLVETAKMLLNDSLAMSGSYFCLLCKSDAIVSNRDLALNIPYNPRYVF